MGDHSRRSRFGGRTVRTQSQGLDAHCNARGTSGTQHRLLCLSPFLVESVHAPCSGTGVIRRHPDIKHLRRESDIAALAVRQRELLEAMWRLLKADGVLLYTTCSILPQENEQVIADFLAQHTDAEIDTIEADWGLATQSGRQLLPAADHDGFFFARLKKRA